MGRRTKEESEAALGLAFAALADGSRRRIIALLRESGELRVSDIAQVFEMSLNGVSKHVKVLQSAGLVSRRVEGRVHWIAVRWEGLQPAYEYLHAHHHFWNGRVDRLVDYVERKTKGKPTR